MGNTVLPHLMMVMEMVMKRINYGLSGITDYEHVHFPGQLCVNLFAVVVVVVVVVVMVVEEYVEVIISAEVVAFVTIYSSLLGTSSTC